MTIRTAGRYRKKCDPSSFGLTTKPLVTQYPGRVACDPNIARGGVKLAVFNELENTYSHVIMTPIEAMRLMRELAKATEIVLTREEQERWIAERNRPSSKILEVLDMGETE